MAVEREHKANSEDASAALDRVKALKELESMDLTHLQTLVNLLSGLKAQETAQSEQGMKKVAQQPLPQSA